MGRVKSLVLEDIHVKLGTKMVEFAGYLMPLQYSSVINEHLAVRNSVGIFDVSHMGEFLLEGEHALELIQKISSNDAKKLKNGQAQYAYLPNENGGIIDDMLVYKLHEEKYMLVVNASNIQKNWDWIQRQNEWKVPVKNISNATVLLAIQGPKAENVLQKITDVDLKKIPYYHFVEGKIGGVENVIISATGYTGAGGFELYVPSEFGAIVWKSIMNAGKDEEIKPAGLAARDTLRLEMGYCLYGNDINEETSPIAAGLGWVTKFTKPFINASFLQSQKEQGTENKLVAFVMEERGIPRAEYSIVDENQGIIGRVTSGTQSPILKKGIGLGYVKRSFSKSGTTIFILIRNKLVQAKVKKLPLIG